MRHNSEIDNRMPGEVRRVHVREVGPRDGLGRLIGMAREAQDVLGRKLTSHSLVAGPVQWIKTGEPACQTASH